MGFKLYNNATNQREVFEASPNKERGGEKQLKRPLKGVGCAIKEKKGGERGEVRKSFYGAVNSLHKELLDIDFS